MPNPQHPPFDHEATPCATVGHLSVGTFDHQAEKGYLIEMKYRVRLEKTDEGVAVSVPGLPGCWSQRATEEEALANIADAIREYLAVVDDEIGGGDVREIDVAV